MHLLDYCAGVSSAAGAGEVLSGKLLQSIAVEEARSAQPARALELVRPGIATSCRSTRNSTSLVEDLSLLLVERACSGRQFLIGRASAIRRSRGVPSVNREPTVRAPTRKRRGSAQAPPCQRQANPDPITVVSTDLEF